MKNIVLPIQFMNSDLLHEELDEILPGQFFGVSTGKSGVVAHVADDVTNEDVGALLMKCLVHNPAGETRAQKAHREETDKLAELAKAVDVPVDPEKNYTVKELVGRIRWLEAVVFKLTGNALPE